MCPKNFILCRINSHLENFNVIPDLEILQKMCLKRLR